MAEEHDQPEEPDSPDGSDRDPEELEVAKTTLRKLFRAAADLKDELSLDESMFRGVAPEAITNSRDFFVFEALDEIQKMCGVLLPLVEAYAGPEDEDAPPGDAAARIIKEGLTDQAALWQRKLNEFLADLIAFRRTNEIDYYRDHILLTRLDQMLGAQTDERDFWRVESNNVAHQIAELVAQIRALEKDLDLDRAWYRARRGALPDPARRPLLSSFKSRLLVALEGAEDVERIGLGLTYRKLFGRASESIHGRAGRLDLPEGSLRGELQIAIVLGIHVLVAAQKLVEKIPGEHNRFFREGIDKNELASALVGRFTTQRAEVGDLVFTHGELCQVLDVSTGPFGYKAYKVRYLTRRLIPEIEEDYVPAPQTALMLNAASARAMLEQQVQDGKVPDKESEMLRSLPDDKLVEYMSRAYVELWNAGVGFKEAMTAQVTKPRGQPKNPRG